MLLFCPSVLAVNERHQQNVPFSCVNYSSVSSQMLLLTCTKLKEAVPLFLPPHIKWFLPILQIAQKTHFTVSELNANEHEEIAQNPPMELLL